MIRWNQYTYFLLQQKKRHEGQVTVQVSSLDPLPQLAPRSNYYKKQIEMFHQKLLANILNAKSTDGATITITKDNDRIASGKTFFAKLEDSSA